MVRNSYPIVKIFIDNSNLLLIDNKDITRILYLPLPNIFIFFICHFGVDIASHFKEGGKL